MKKITSETTLKTSKSLHIRNIKNNNRPSSSNEGNSVIVNKNINININ